MLEYTYNIIIWIERNSPWKSKLQKWWNFSTHYSYFLSNPFTAMADYSVMEIFLWHLRTDKWNFEKKIILFNFGYWQKGYSYVSFLIFTVFSDPVSVFVEVERVSWTPGNSSIATPYTHDTAGRRNTGWIPVPRFQGKIYKPGSSTWEALPGLI